MRPPVTKDSLRELRRAVGRAARGPGRVYFAGGATALELGWREATLDVDLSLDPEPPGVFATIDELKRRLDINVELASPADFVPALPGWRERARFIERVGEVDFLDYDLYTQALSKLARGFERDRRDVAAMVEGGHVDPRELSRLFEASGDALLRYPALDVDGLRAAVLRLVAGGRA